MSNPFPDFGRLPWVYVAGPYSGGDVVVNVQNAVHAANRLWAAKFFPYIPHLTHLWHMITPKSYDEWMELDLQALSMCGALLRLPGDSPGADKEVEFARSHNIPVYYSVAEVHAGAMKTW